MANIFKIPSAQSAEPIPTPPVEEVVVEEVETEEVDSEETDVEEVEAEYVDENGEIKKSSDTPPPAEDTLNPVEEGILQFFNEETTKDKAFAAKYVTTQKSIHDVFNYLYEKHRPANRGKVACAKCTDDHQLAKEFIMDDTIKLKSSEPKAKAPKSTQKSNSKKSGNNVRIPNNTASVTIESVKDGKKKIDAAVIVPSSKPAQKTIFDFAVDDGIDLF